MITQTESYLGPAEVVSAGGTCGIVQVRLLDGEQVAARLALAQPYAPAAGDEVLVISQKWGEAYVIGVLHGRGVTTLQVPADLTIAAPNGSIRLSAGRHLELNGKASIDLVTPKATVRATRLNILATTLVQRLGSAFTWAKDLLQWKSGRVRTVVDEGWLLRADRVHTKTSGNTCINGKTVHLG